ncbi:MAG: hypothetical protein RLZZ127_2248 [Planctomycetota bacterium]|jgi:hypothetical protein
MVLVRLAVLSALLAVAHAGDATVADLQRRIEALERTVATLQQQLAESGTPQARLPPGLLADIRLPANPSREQVALYIDAVLATGAGRKSWSSVDPQVSKLAAVGPDYVDLLLDSTDSHQGELWISSAAEKLITARHRELVLSRLRDHVFLAAMVRKFGWQDDARQIITAGLETGMYLPEAWLAIAVDYKDPALTPLLRRLLVQGPNRSHVYPVVRRAVGIDLDAAVQEAWEAMRAEGFGPSPSAYDLHAFAGIAANHGIRDALVHLVEARKDPTLGDYERQTVRASLRQACKGSVDAFVDATVARTAVWDAGMRSWRPAGATAARGVEAGQPSPGF